MSLHLARPIASNVAVVPQTPTDTNNQNKLRSLRSQGSGGGRSSSETSRYYQFNWMHNHRIEQDSGRGSAGIVGDAFVPPPKVATLTSIDEQHRIGGGVSSSHNQQQINPHQQTTTNHSGLFTGRDAAGTTF